MTDLEELVKVGVVAPDHDLVAARAWLGVVHEVARGAAGRVRGEMRGPERVRSFYAQAVVLPAGPVTLLLNPTAGLVACVKDEHPFPASAQFTLVPSPETFTRSGFRVAAPEGLEARVSERVFDQVGGAEADDLRYFKPVRLGDVFFNWFD